MDRTRLTGMIIMAGSVIQLLAFIIGLARRSYLAIALPVTLALAGISALGIWVGWTMMTTESDVPEPDEIEQPAGG